ncbi:hypothetical protein DFJ73DRAFT_768069 [Zopfochytrium polystomum]|nr:hypothetical protein DFJ73DRAFT_768069 [Zopfochytrium polystomum]
MRILNVAGYTDTAHSVHSDGKSQLSYNVLFGGPTIIWTSVQTSTVMFKLLVLEVQMKQSELETLSQPPQPACSVKGGPTAAQEKHDKPQSVGGKMKNEQQWFSGRIIACHAVDLVSALCWNQTNDLTLARVGQGLGSIKTYACTHTRLHTYTHTVTHSVAKLNTVLSCSTTAGQPEFMSPPQGSHIRNCGTNWGGTVDFGKPNCPMAMAVHWRWPASRLGFPKAMVKYEPGLSRFRDLAVMTFTTQLIQERTSSRPDNFVQIALPAQRMNLGMVTVFMTVILQKTLLMQVIVACLKIGLSSKVVAEGNRLAVCVETQEESK